jgi:hypothetical protein
MGRRKPRSPLMANRDLQNFELAKSVIAAHVTCRRSSASFVGSMLDIITRVSNESFSKPSVGWLTRAWEGLLRTASALPD